MSEIKFPKNSLQMYISDELKLKLTEGMTRRGLTVIAQYVRQLVDEDIANSTEPMSAEESNEIALEQDLANAEFKSAQVQPRETDLDSVII